MIHSNPYFDVQPNLDKPLVKQAESFSTRIRDTFTHFIFYHKKKTFAVMGVLAALEAAMMICPWLLVAPVMVTVSLSVVGAILAFVTAIVCYIESYLFGWDSGSNKLEFKMIHDQNILNSLTNEVMGKADLEYFDDKNAQANAKKIPQLRITADTPEKAGFVQGYVLGKQGDEMNSRLKKMYKVLRILNVFGYKLPKWGSEAFTQPFYKNLPASMKDELNGVMAGHNQWAREHHRPLVTMGDLMMMHFLPDTHNLKQLFAAGELLSTGCTAGVVKNKDGSIVHFRNTDWPSYNIADRVSVMVERHIGEREITRTLTFPLCIGCAFGENEHGLTLSINVSPGATVFNEKGTLAFLLYRRLLDECKTVAEVIEKVTHDKNYQPIGPCQLTVSDNTTGAIVRFYQIEMEGNNSAANDVTLYGKDKQGAMFTHEVSRLSDTQPLLVVANEGLVYDKKTKAYVRGNHHDAQQRIDNVHRCLKSALANDVSSSDALGALRAPLVNNCQTVHTIVKKGNETRITAANGFAGRFFPARLGPMKGHEKRPIEVDGCLALV